MGECPALLPSLCSGALCLSLLNQPPFHLPQVFTSSVIETDRAKSWIESKNPVSFQTLGSQGNMEVECVEAVTLPGNRAAVTGDLR